jgi:hypothetical protein
VLAPVLVLLAVLTLATGAAVAGIGAAARASLHAAARAAIVPGFHHALGAYQSGIAAAIAAQLAANPPDAASGVAEVGVPAALADPAGLAPPPRLTERVPPFTLTEDLTNTTLAAPACTAPAAGGAADADTAIAVQCSPWVAESRLSGAVTVSVWGADPAANPNAVLFAQETETFVFRLVADPPYAMLAGVKTGDARDPAADSVTAPSPHEGDAAGYSTVASPLATPPGDTTIHVTYQCLPSAAGRPCPAQPLPGTPGDDPVSLRWHDGNDAPPSGSP